jgi:hypothetical protein
MCCGRVAERITRGAQSVAAHSCNNCPFRCLDSMTVFFGIYSKCSRVMSKSMQHEFKLQSTTFSLRFGCKCQVLRTIYMSIGNFFLHIQVADNHAQVSLCLRPAPCKWNAHSLFCRSKCVIMSDDVPLFLSESCRPTGHSRLDKGISSYFIIIQIHVVRILGLRGSQC